MTLDDIDKSQLIHDSYRIDGISAPECRSIFMDWALKLPAEISSRTAIQRLLAEYGAAHPDHPMTAVLREGLGAARPAVRRGGRRARLGQA